MAKHDETLPEGTDKVVNGASSTAADDRIDDMDADTDTDDESDPRARAGASGGESPFGAQGFKSAFEGKAQGFMDQAGDKAKEYVAEGLGRATTALDDVVRMVEDAAGTIDEKVGAQYGDYARRASGAISGFADTLRSKDADTLFEDAREAVRKSPAIAIGAAAALGFVVARIVLAGMPEKTGAATGKAPTLADNDPIIPKA